jgi:hypothetical protein
MRTVNGNGPAICFALTAFLLLNIMVSFQTAQAAAGPKEYVQINAAVPLADNLIAMKGRTVAVSLTSGQIVTGVVKEVQNNLLHLEKLSQKEFYDAIIRVDLIVAIEVRVR